MDILFWVHVFLTLSLITIPFWPIKYLEYGVYIPLLLSIIWIIFNGCPFSILHKVDSSSFSQDILRFFIPKASDKLTEHVNTFLLIFITFSGFYRLQNNVNKIETN
jgi:hypothetical protein